MARQALVIVDLQVGAFDGARDPPLVDGERLLERVCALLEVARAVGVPIVFVQDCGRVGGAYEEGTPHWRLHPALARRPGELVIRKRHPSAFKGTSLASTLASLAVRELVVCGQRSDGCLQSTCLDALAAGLRLTLVGDAHGTPGERAAAVAARVNREFEERGASVQEVARVTASWRAGGRA